MYKQSPIIKRLETWLHNADQTQLNFAKDFLSRNGYDLYSNYGSPYIKEDLIYIIQNKIWDGREDLMKGLLSELKSEWRTAKFRLKKESLNISLSDEVFKQLNNLCKHSKIPNCSKSALIAELIEQAHKKIEKKAQSTHANNKSNP